VISDEKIHLKLEESFQIWTREFCDTQRSTP